MPHREPPVEDEGQNRSHPRSPSSGTSAFDVARRVLVRVEDGAYATLTLAGELERARLPEVRRPLATELVYGSLRRQGRIDRALAALAPRGLKGLDPQVRALLRLGAYQILFMRTPAPLVVSQVVEVVNRLRGPGLGGFANALLRRLSREGEPPLPPLPGEDAPAATVAQAIADRHDLPPFLAADMVAQLGRGEAIRLAESLELPAPVWLRLNLLRGSRAEAVAALAQDGVEVAAEPAPPGLPEALRLAGGHPFGGAAYGEGWFTAQDLGAQLVARLLVADREPAGACGLVAGPILDACAGVGGKSTHLAALLGNSRDIDAADTSARKLELLADHTHRLGCRSVRPIAVDLGDARAVADRLRPGYAAILLDAPCSGVGVLRRHPEARRRLTPAKVRELVAIQRQILANLVPRLLPGGVLVYAVCSFLAAEGPEQAAWLLDRYPDLRPLPPAKAPPWDRFVVGEPPSAGAIRTFPHRDDADGFYAVRLIRGHGC